MAFEIPTLDDTHAFLIALAKNLFASLNGGKGPDVSRGSFVWLWTRTLAGGVTDNHAHIASVKNDLLPDTALDDMLDRWGGIKGIPRKPATPARKSKALRVTGTPTTTVSTGLVLTHTSNLSFQITNTDLVGPLGYVDMDIEALSAGAVTRLSALEHLTFAAAPAGISEDAELQLDLDDGGEDRESNGDYRVRILDAFSDPPLGGAQHDYVTWALEVAGVGSAYAYPKRVGVGTVDVAALKPGSGGDRLLTAPEVAVAQAYLDTKRPVSVIAARVLLVTSLAVDVDYTVVTDGSLEHAFDWDDNVAPTVAAWTALTRTLQFTGGSRPATMKVGDRLTIKPLAGGGSGKQRVIEAFTGGDSVILEQLAGADDPAAGDTIYAGGAIVEPVRLAILALIDSLGTANPDAVRYGSWEGNLRPIAIGRVATSIDGVVDGTVVAPGATVAAADLPVPDDGTIQLLIPGRILVRAQH